MRFSKFLASRGFLIGAIVLSTADVAVAQITATGTNFPEPVTNGTTNNYTIGWGGVGTLSILGGSSFTAGSLDAGDLGTGNGTITIDGSGTTVTLSSHWDRDRYSHGDCQQWNLEHYVAAGLGARARQRE
jgi:hypothetical protein